MLAAMAMVLATIVLPATALGKGGGKGRSAAWSDGAAQRKADYVYMEAMRQNALENDDAYFELLRGSRDLDSTDTQPEIGRAHV